MMALVIIDRRICLRVPDLVEIEAMILALLMVLAAIVCLMASYAARRMEFPGTQRASNPYQADT